MPASFRVQRKARPRRRRGPSSLLWDLSIALAEIAGVVVVGCLCFSLQRLDWRFIKRFEAILPESVSHIFASGAAIADDAGVGAMKSRTQENFDRLTPAAASGERRTFGMGSTQKEVLAAQGAPSSSGGNIWRYGASEVYFLGGRVIGWRDTPGHPLSLR